MLCPPEPSKEVAYSILVTDESNTTAPVQVELPCSTPAVTVYVPPGQLNVSASAICPLNTNWLKAKTNVDRINLDLFMPKSPSAVIPN